MCRFAATSTSLVSFLNFPFSHVINRLYISARLYEFDILMKTTRAKIVSILGLWDETTEIILESVKVRIFLNLWTIQVQ